MGALRFIIAGGGTGGHIFPAIAIANAIRHIEKEAEILFIGAQGKMEMEKVPDAGYKIEGLTIAGFNRSSLIKNVSLPYKLIKSFYQVGKIFRNFKPDAVIGVGGYSSFPVLRYAQMRGFPTFVHESNSFPGKSNILLGKKASLIFLPVSGMEHYFPAGKTLVTGNPVRQSIVKINDDRDTAIRAFGLDPGKQTILSIGGSLGAKNINESLSRGLHVIIENGLQLIWQTGKPYLQQAKEDAGKLKEVFINDFITEMHKAYAAADIVISRSGAMSVSELSLVKKPVVFVPYPFAAEDHQTVNAQTLVNKNAALLIKDSEAAEKLIPTVIKLAFDDQKRAQLSENISRFGVADADKVIALQIINKVRNN